MNRLRKFLRLNSTERRLLVMAAVLLLTVKLGLRLLPFQTLRRVLAMWAKVGKHRSRGTPADMTIWAVEAASHYLVGARGCLVQALATQVLLSRQGHSTRIRIGSAWSCDNGLQVHAWVESQNRIVIGGSETLFQLKPFLVFNEQLEPQLPLDE